MFVVQFADGSTFTEEQGTWDDVPDKAITAVRLTLPVKAKLKQEDGTVVDLPAPCVTLDHYSKYYCAKEAVAAVLATNGVDIAAGSGQGVVTKEILGGIDLDHDLVVYIEVDKRANVTIKRFPVSKLKVRQETLKRGI